MKVGITYWKDMVGGKTERMELELKPFGFQTAKVTQVKPLIADRDVTVKRGEVATIRIETVTLPKDTIIGPLNIARHALGIVLDVVECGVPVRVEEEKCMSNVIFLPIEDGEIKKGDVVGFIKIFFIKTGLLGRITGEPKPEIIKQEAEANLVWKENGNIIRERTLVRDIVYGRTHLAVWMPVVAAEDANLRAGKVAKIRIKEITLPPNGVVVPIGYMMNAYGSLIDILSSEYPKFGGELKLNQAIFLPLYDSKIEKGDLLGVIMIYFVGLEELKELKFVIPEEESEFVFVYRSGEGIVKKKMKLPSFGFKRNPSARWEAIVANEKKTVKIGEPSIISIKPIKLPKNTIVYPLYMMRNAFGTVVDTVLTKMAKVEEEREISKIVFMPIANGEIQKGDLIGVLNVYEVQISSSGKLRSWLSEWIEMQATIYD